MAALTFSCLTGAYLLLPTAAKANWGQDITSETVNACLSAVPGDPSIRDAMSAIGWREVNRLDRKEKHISALATFDFNDSMFDLLRRNSLPLSPLYIAVPDDDDVPENIYNLAWNHALQDVKQQVLRPNVRNSPRQTIWFDRPESNAFLQIKTDSKETWPATDCDIAVTADIGEASIAVQFQEFSAPDIALVTGAPLQWSENGKLKKLTYRTFYDTAALDDLIADGFDFIGHVQVKHYINRHAQQ